MLPFEVCFSSSPPFLYGTNIDYAQFLIFFFFFWFSGVFRIHLFSSVFWFSWSISEVRVACPLVSFFFACLGASLGASRAFFPLVENFIFKGSILGIILGDLFSLLCQSIDWFKGLVSERGIISEVRSSELEIGLSSSDDPMEMGDDTAISIPREVKAFSALGEECGLDAKILSRFSQRFQFSDRVRVRLP